MNKFLKGMKEGNKMFGENIAGIVNTTLLIIVYFVAVGPTSLVAKIFGKNFLDLKKNEKIISYWKDIDSSSIKINDYYRQF